MEYMYFLCVSPCLKICYPSYTLLMADLLCATHTAITQVKGDYNMNTETKIELVSKCHDIQVSLGNKTVPEYETITEIGMMVRLALHLRGLPLINYEILRLVADYYLQIPSLVLKNIVEYLAEIDFVKIDKQGNTINSILPTVPYFDDVYEIIGDFAEDEKRFNENEQFVIELLKRLSDSPLHKSNIYEFGAEKKTVNRTLLIGSQGGFLLERKARGKDIVISPTYFMDNLELYTDLVAKTGAKSIEKINKLLKEYQGWPLSLIEKHGEINGTKLTHDEIQLLKRLACDGAVKPPSINTTHHGTNYFMFTPTPGIARLHPGKKEIYERALALVASVRQGQFLPAQYAIRSPYKLLAAFRDRGYLNANTEAFEQYRKLTVMRMCRLEDVGGGWHRLSLIDSEENKEALEIAISLISNSSSFGTEIDEEVRFALQQDQEYIESKRSSTKLRETEKITLSEEQQIEIDNLLLGGKI